MSAVLVAGSAVFSVRFPTVLGGKATMDGDAERAFVLPRVPSNYKLLRDDGRGYALTVPRSFEEFDLSRKHLADIDAELRRNPDAPMGPVWRQIKDMVAHGVVMVGTDNVTENQVALAVVPHVSGPLPDDLADQLADEIEESGDTFLSGDRTTVAGREAVRVTARLGGTDGSEDPELVTELFVANGGTVWRLTIWYSQMDDPTLEPILTSLRLS